MGERSVFLRCAHCGVVNRIPVDRLMDKPKCGKCKNPLEFPLNPVDVTDANFKKEVMSWPGVALVEFWAPW